MDFGGGTGDLCIELAQNGMDVTYCDIGEALFNFAQWRFQKRNLSVRMIRELSTAADGSLDGIVSFDAFEHVKDLPEVVGQLVRCLRKGGMLIFSGAFSGGTLHLEENERYNEFKNLDQLMRQRGLSSTTRAVGVVEVMPGLASGQG